MGNEGTSKATHTTGTGRAEDIRDRDGQEAGRDESGATHANRPAGTSTARDSTGINPEDVESTTGGPTKPPA